MDRLTEYQLEVWEGLAAEHESGDYNEVEEMRAIDRHEAARHSLDLLSALCETSD